MRIVYNEWESGEILNKFGISKFHNRWEYTIRSGSNKALGVVVEPRSLPSEWKGRVLLH